MTLGFIIGPKVIIPADDATTCLTEFEARFRILQGLLPVGINLMAYSLDYSTTNVLWQFRKGYDTTIPCTLVHPFSLLPIRFIVMGTLRHFWCPSRAPR